MGAGFQSPRFTQGEHCSLADPGNKIRIIVGGVQVEAELKGTKTAREVYAALPVEAPVNTWGKSFILSWTASGIIGKRQRIRSRWAMSRFGERAKCWRFSSAGRR